MDRRRQTRQARRLQVHFWKRGEVSGSAGYTHNLSATGMFVGTNSPLPVGTRVRVEVIDPELGFLVEGEVVHAAKVAPVLQKLRSSGMGVRFLTPEDLVRPLFRDAVNPPRPAAEPALPAEPAPVPRLVQERPAPPSRSPDGVFPVIFRDARQFVEVFQRDIRNGGLFIPTQVPAGLNQKIVVELELPGDSGHLRFPARVVQRIDPTRAGQRPGVTAGMGVAFLDPEGVLERLRPEAERFSG